MHDRDTPETVRKFLKYAAVGLLGYAINALFLDLISSATHIEILAWILSTELAIMSNFFLNNAWTFKNEKVTGARDYIRKFIHFNGTSAGAIVIEAVLGTWGVAVFGANHRQIILAVVVVCAVIPYNWLMYTRVIWKKKNSENKKVELSEKTTSAKQKATFATPIDDQ